MPRSSNNRKKKGKKQQRSGNKGPAHARARARARARVAVESDRLVRTNPSSEPATTQTLLSEAEAQSLADTTSVATTTKTNVAEDADADPSVDVELDKILAEDLWSDDSKTVQDALNSLIELTYEDPDTDDKEAADQHKNKIMESGFAVSFVSLLQRWIDDALLQKYACVIVMNVTYNSNSNGIQCEFLKTGGLDAIVHSMMRHPRNSDVQNGACAALGNLVIAQQCSDRAVNTLEAHMLVLRAMKTFPFDPIVQRNAVFALHKMLLWDICKQAFRNIRSDVIQLLERAITNHRVERRKSKTEHVVAMRITAKKTLKQLHRLKGKNSNDANGGDDDDDDRRCCLVCAKSSDEVRIYTCSRCGNATYCSTSCQREAWYLHHKFVCEKQE